MSFEESLKKLRQHYVENNILNGVSALLGWDEFAVCGKFHVDAQDAVVRRRLIV